MSVVRNYLSGEEITHLLPCSLQISRIPKTIHLGESSRETVGAVSNSPCHRPQEVRSRRRRAQSPLRLFGIDRYLTGGTPQQGANFIGERKRFAFFADSLRQFPHRGPIECFGHCFTYRVSGWHRSKGHCLCPSQ